MDPRGYNTSNARYLYERKLEETKKIKDELLLEYEDQADRSPEDVSEYHSRLSCLLVRIQGMKKNMAEMRWRT